MIIRIVTVVALVAALVGIDGDSLADSKAGDFRPDPVDRTYELVSERQEAVLFAGKGSLRERTALKFKLGMLVCRQYCV